jgi:hypothetical protein
MLPGWATAEYAEIAALGFVIAGILNAVVNTQAVARYLGGNIVLSNLLVRPPPTGRPWIGVYGGSHCRLILPWQTGSE